MQSISAIAKAPSLPGYRMLRALGEGSMGVVWLAEELDRPGELVAIKVVHPSVEIREQELERLVQRLYREARVGGSIEHPHVLPIRDIAYREGSHFLVMDYCPGRSLAEWIRAEKEQCAQGGGAAQAAAGPRTRSGSGAARPRPALESAAHGGPANDAAARESATRAAGRRAAGTNDMQARDVPERESQTPGPPAFAWSALDLKGKLRLFAGIADALAHCHELGVVHRDVKPGNILVREDGRAFLIDFGLARNFEVDSTLTASHMLLGTPVYMSPEQAFGQGDRVDARSDIFSLGASLYHALTLRAPFDGASFLQLRDRILHTDPPRPTELVPGLPRGIEAVIQKAMEKRREHRFQTAAELRDELLRLADGEPTRTGSTAVELRRTARLLRRRAVPLLLICLAVVSVVMGSWGYRVQAAAKEARQDGEITRALGAHDPDHAVELLLKAIEFEPTNAEQRLELASVYAVSDRLDEAQKVLQELASRGLAPDPDAAQSADDHYRLGLAAMTTRNWDEAARRFARALEIDPQHRRSHFQSYMALRASGKLEAAGKELEEYLFQTPEADKSWSLAKAQLLELRGRYDEAVEVLRDSAKNYTKSLVELAVPSHIGRIRTAQALTLENASTVPDPERLAQVLSEARTELETALELRAQDGTALHHLAIVAWLQGQRGAAREYADRAVSLRRFSFETRLLACKIHLEAGAPNEAVRLLREAPEAQRSRPDHALALAFCLCTQAWAEPRSAEDSSPGAATAAGDSPDRRALAEAALACDPLRAEADVYLGQELWLNPPAGTPNDTRLRGALAHFERAISNWPARVSDGRPGWENLWLRQKDERYYLYAAHIGRLWMGRELDERDLVVAELDYLRMHYPNDFMPESPERVNALNLAEAVATLPPSLEDLRDCDWARSLLNNAGWTVEELATTNPGAADVVSAIDLACKQ
jgi:serine/threonine protein kinase/Flp pilus assembly protein TadD